MKDHQRRAPLSEAMKAYAGSGALAFHTPGHKQGLGAHPLLKRLITPEGLREEVSLMTELDDLGHPSMCIKEAQDLAAELYGADAAYFMINGTTGALHTMLLSVLQPGDTVLVPRNAHRSIMGGLILCGARPVYLQPAVDVRLGIAQGLTTESVAAAVAAHPEAKALVAVYPTYYGVAADLPAIAAIVHAHGMLLLVDEAHGPHLPFSEALPAEAIACGADMAALSTHKLLGSLTQTSMLLVQSARVEQERVRQTAALLASTSPNYLLLASLDIARLQMAEEGQKRLDRAVRLAGAVRQSVNAADGLWCFGTEYMGQPGAAALDVTKLTVQVSGLGLTGAEAEHILRCQYHLQCELADAYNVLFIISMADTMREASILAGALGCFAQNYRRPQPLALPEAALPEIPPVCLTPREAFFAAAEAVPFTEAVGLVAAEEITFYPPGIPVLNPGEQITAEAVRYVRAMAAVGLKVTGPQDTALATIRVIRMGKSWQKES